MSIEFDIKCSDELHKYIDIILETTEFNNAYSDFQDEIKESIKDNLITTKEIKNISVKMFAVLSALQNTKLKIDGKKANKLKEILKDHMTEILTNLIYKSLNDTMNKHPSLNMIIGKEEIEDIVSIIIATAEFSIEVKTKKCCF